MESRTARTFHPYFFLLSARGSSVPAKSDVVVIPSRLYPLKTPVQAYSVPKSSFIFGVENVTIFDYSVHDGSIFSRLVIWNNDMFAFASEVVHFENSLNGVGG